MSASEAPICVRCGEEFEPAQVVAGEPCPKVRCDGILAEPCMGQLADPHREGGPE